MIDQQTINSQILEIIKTAEHWKTQEQFVTENPQFKKSQIKNLFWKRDKHVGLSRCYRQIGKKSYICVPLFFMWAAGQLPEQQGGDHE